MQGSQSNNPDQIRKSLFKLRGVKNPADLIAGAKSASDLLEAGDTPLPKDCLTDVTDICARLSGIDDAEVSLGLLEAIKKRAMLHVADVDMRAAINNGVRKVSQVRMQKRDLAGAVLVHSALFKELLAATPSSEIYPLTVFLNITDAFRTADDYDDQELLFEEAHAVAQKLWGASSQEAADALEFLGTAYRNQGYYEEAFERYLQSKSIQDKLFQRGQGYESSFIYTLLTMSEAARQGGFPERADEMVALLKLKQEKKLLDQRQQCDFYSLVAKLADLNGNQAEAIEAYKQCLELLKDLPADHAFIERQRIALDLARIYSERNEPQLVEKYYAEAVSVVDKIDVSYADEVSDNLFHISSYYTEARNYARAEELLEFALRHKKKAAKHRYIEFELFENEIATVRKLRAAESKRSDKTLESLLGEIESMVGLQELKQALRDHGVYLDFLQMRRERGFESAERPVLHAVFMGNPGTGKTTVAKLLGEVYHRLGLLSKGHVHTVVRADLIGSAYGAGEKGAQRALAAAKGGVLFIDEAYSLSRHDFEGVIDQRDPGQQVIETLLPVMTDPDSDIAIVVAGYPKEMTTFLDSNPGLKSRFKLHFDFPDYNPPEMLEIGIAAAKRNDIILSEGAQQALLEVLENAYKARDKAFGNARYVHGLVDECKRAMAMRIMRSSKLKMMTNEEVSVVTADDVRRACKTRNATAYHAPIDEKLLAQSLAALDAHVGLKSVKEFIHDFVKIVRVYRELGKDVLNSMKFHLVFCGNPGTGKTTIARIIADIYKALGILERGHLVEVDRAGLIGQYIGQTEIQTKKKIQEAMGGVLFVDEAYALTATHENDFGPRAIEVILKEMEDKRGKFFMVFAGYKKEMQQFLDANPGLRSRVDKTIDFADYTAAEMEQMCVTMLQTHDLVLEESARKLLRQKLDSMPGTKGFANGRSARSLVERIVMKHFAALGEIPSAERTAEALTTVTASLLEQLELGDVLPKRPVGF